MPLIPQAMEHILKQEDGKERYLKHVSALTKAFALAVKIISKAVVSDRVIDIFAAADLKKPDISILSEEFLSEVNDLPQKNLAFEMIKKILNDKIKIRSKKNLVQSKFFRKMLEKTIKRYTNKSIKAAEVIE